MGQKSAEIMGFCGKAAWQRVFEVKFLVRLPPASKIERGWPVCFKVPAGTRQDPSIQ
jgi:hypothetical protein